MSNIYSYNLYQNCFNIKLLKRLNLPQHYNAEDEQYDLDGHKQILDKGSIVIEGRTHDVQNVALVHAAQPAGQAIKEIN